MKKIIKKIVVFLLVLLFVTFVLALANQVLSNASLEESREVVTDLVAKKYPSYEIVDLQLKYVDWSSTVSNADDDHHATKATAIIKNSEEQRTLQLKMLGFGIWKIYSSEPNYGPNVPNGVYFAREEFVNVGCLVDIEEHIKTLWVVPDENGNLYKKCGEENSYYSFKECKGLYKTENGYIYSLNKETLEWEKSSENYADLCFYGNYEKVTEKYVTEMIEKYGSLNENIELSS